MWKRAIISVSACLLIQTVSGLPVAARHKRQQPYVRPRTSPTGYSATPVPSPPTAPGFSFGDVLPSRRERPALSPLQQSRSSLGGRSGAGGQEFGGAGYSGGQDGARPVYSAAPETLIGLASLPGQVDGFNANSGQGIRYRAVPPSQRQTGYVPTAASRPPGYNTAQTYPSTVKPAIESHVVPASNLQSNFNRNAPVPVPAPVPRPNYSPDSSLNSNFITAPGPQQNYAVDPASQFNHVSNVAAQQNLHAPTSRPSYTPIPISLSSHTPPQTPQLERPIPQPLAEQEPRAQSQQGYRDAFEALSGAALASEVQGNIEYNTRNRQSPGNRRNQQAQAYNPVTYTEDPAQYEFQWGVKNADGADFGHREARSGDRTEGTYFVQLPDTRTQTVNYRVNGRSGFVANVQYDGEAQFPRGVGERGGYRPQEERDGVRQRRPSGYQVGKGREPAGYQQVGIRSQSGGQRYASQGESGDQRQRQQSIYHLQKQQTNVYQSQGQQTNGYQPQKQQQLGYPGQQQNQYRSEVLTQTEYQPERLRQDGYQPELQQQQGDQRESGYQREDQQQPGYLSQNQEQYGHQYQNQQRSGYQPQKQQYQAQQQTGYQTSGTQRQGYQSVPQVQSGYQLSEPQPQIGYQA